MIAIISKRELREEGTHELRSMAFCVHNSLQYVCIMGIDSVSIFRENECLWSGCKWRRKGETTPIQRYLNK
jgi:hypothetical protein